MVLCKWGNQQLEGPSWDDIWLSDDTELSSAVNPLVWSSALEATVLDVQSLFLMEVLVIAVY